MSSLSLDGSAVLPARTGYGTGGQPITVYANHVQLVPPSELALNSSPTHQWRPAEKQGERPVITSLDARLILAVRSRRQCGTSQAQA